MKTGIAYLDARYPNARGKLASHHPHDHPPHDYLSRDAALSSAAITPSQSHPGASPPHGDQQEFHMSSVQGFYRPYAGIARFVSDSFSPPVLAVPGLILAAFYCPEPRAIGYAACYFLIAVVAPLLYVVWLLRTGRIDDFHLPRRSDRTRPFLVSAVCGLVAVALLVKLGAPASFLAPIVALLSVIVLLFLVTLAWQVSIHTATISGVAMFAAMALGEVGVACFVLVPLVGWARVYLGRHTIAQAVAGAAIGLGCFALLPTLERLLSQ